MVKTLSLLDFRRNAKRAIASVQRGEHLVLTLRGKPVMRLEPVTDAEVSSDDPFYRLAERPVAGGRESLSNADMDRLIYGA